MFLGQCCVRCFLRTNLLIWLPPNNCRGQIGRNETGNWRNHLSRHRQTFPRLLARVRLERCILSLMVAGCLCKPIGLYFFYHDTILAYCPAGWRRGTLRHVSTTVTTILAMPTGTKNLDQTSITSLKRSVKSSERVVGSTGPKLCKLCEAPAPFSLETCISQRLLRADIYIINANAAFEGVLTFVV